MRCVGAVLPSKQRPPQTAPDFPSLPVISGEAEGGSLHCLALRPPWLLMTLADPGNHTAAVVAWPGFMSTWSHHAIPQSRGPGANQCCTEGLVYVDTHLYRAAHSAYSCPLDSGTATLPTPVSSLQGLRKDWVSQLTPGQPQRVGGAV